MNMIMDNNQHQRQASPPTISPERADLHIATTPPTTPLSPSMHNNNNNNDKLNSPNTITNASPSPTGKVTLKRSFDVAFLMMPDERIKQKQAAEKQARLSEAIERHHHHQQHLLHQYPTDLSPRMQQQTQQHLQHLHEQAELFHLHESRRYPQITIRSPRIYDDPTVIIPAAAATAAAESSAAAAADSVPMKSAFTKVLSSRLESPPVVEPQPPLSPDQLSCSSISPPISTTPPRTNSGNGSLSNCSSSSSAPPCLNQNIVYQSFRPEYQLNNAFQSVSQVQALQQAQRIKQQLMYQQQQHRPPLNISSGVNGNSSGTGGPPDFMPSYSGFPFPPGAAAHHFANVGGPPELPRIVQNPAAAAILSTLIPPTLASTFTLTAQNVCAKCNISFRMTSDLVYHMRSHHKSEITFDPNRRKREEKLKCPVCQESFRERHHLTRHMTAHQDKESDHQTPTGGVNSSSQSDIINVGGGGSHRHHSPRVSGVSK